MAEITIKIAILLITDLLTKELHTHDFDYTLFFFPWKCALKLLWTAVLNGRCCFQATYRIQEMFVREEFFRLMLLLKL